MCMEKAILSEFRTLRLRHLKYGIGEIDDIERYKRMTAEVWEFIDSLSDISERRVMELLYIHGRGSTYAGIVLHYSESQVRRIRRRVLNRLE